MFAIILLLLGLTQADDHGADECLKYKKEGGCGKHGAKMGCIWNGSQCVMAEKDECDTHMTCGECMDDEVCIFETEKGMCMFGETAPMEGKYAFMKESCPPSDMCDTHMTCGECMDDQVCIFETEKGMCMFGETAPMDGKYAFMKESCPPTDMCDTHMTCGECMDDQVCIYETEKGMCMFGETAPMEGKYAFMKESCPPTDMCDTHMTCGECMDDDVCIYEKSKGCMFGETAPMEGDYVFMANMCPSDEDPCECKDEFMYKGMTYTECTVTSYMGKSWCYVKGGDKCPDATASTKTEGEYYIQNCGNPCDCKDEFTYMMQTYTECTDADDTLPWCYIKDGANCKDATASSMTPGSYYRYCENPCECKDEFEFDGKKYTECTDADDDQKWCYIKGYDKCPDAKKSSSSDQYYKYCDEEKKKEMICIGEIKSKDEECAMETNKEDCESHGKSIFSDGVCDWVEKPDLCAKCKKMKCMGQGACLLNEGDGQYSCEVDAEHFTDAEVCKEDDGYFCEDACDKLEGCPALKTCGECMEDMTCIYDKDSHKCFFAETAPMEGSWVFMKDQCPAKDCSKYTDPCSCKGECGWSSENNACESSDDSKTTCDECALMDGCIDKTCKESDCPMEFDGMRICQCTSNCEDYGNCCDDAKMCKADMCSMYKTCGECMDDETCLFEKSMGCMFGETAPFEGDYTDYVFMKASCPADAEDSCYKNPKNDQKCEKKCCGKQDGCEWSDDKDMCYTPKAEEDPCNKLSGQKKACKKSKGMKKGIVCKVKKDGTCAMDKSKSDDGDDTDPKQICKAASTKDDCSKANKKVKGKKAGKCKWKKKNNKCMFKA